MANHSFRFVVILLGFVASFVVGFAAGFMSDAVMTSPYSYSRH